MSQGIYTTQEVARYLRMRPQEVARMIAEDGLPCLKLPGNKTAVRKIALTPLRDWLAARHGGAAFCTVEQLAAEIEMANAPGQTPEEQRAWVVFNETLRTVLESVKTQTERGLAA